MSILLRTIMLCLCIHAQAWLPPLKKSLIAGIEASPTLLVLLPAYILYAEHDKLGKEPLTPACDQRVRYLLKKAGYRYPEKLNLRKLNPCLFLDHEECSALQGVLPLKKIDNKIIVVPAPYTLYIDERACMQLTEEQLLSRILPCALFVQHKVLEKTILSALVTPVATDYSMRIVQYVVGMLIEALCTEISQNHPILGKIMCSSNSVLEWMLTNFLTKFILNTQIIQFLTKHHLKTLEIQAQKLLNDVHEKNTDTARSRDTKNCSRGSYRAAC